MQHAVGAYRLLLTAYFVCRSNCRLDAAADREITDDRHASRTARTDEIIENLIGDCLVEDPSVAEPDHVVLQRLQLDAAIGGHVRDANFTEVWETCFRADGRELRTVDRDLELPFRARIRECLDRCRA